ncbi:MAG: hypothetical protein ABIQ31_01725, partial [Ferruginibacter sp.]
YMGKITKNITAVALNECELKEFYDLDLSNYPSLDKVRDLFIVSVNTGLRFNELYQVSRDNIKNDPDQAKGKLLAITGKTGSTAKIEINEVVDQVLQKYRYHLPAVASINIVNSCLKNICRMVDSLNKLIMIDVTIDGTKELKAFKKYEVISVHAGRKTFVNNRRLSPHR